MGCNESKHDAVATGNTILRRKQSDNVKSTKDIETVKENPTAEIVHDVHHANDVASTAIKERNLDDQKMESKEEDQQVVEGDDRERPISRDSSTKDVEEAILGNNIDEIISEGRSGKSEYNTPRHKDDDHVIKADPSVNVDDHDHVGTVLENDKKEVV